MLVVRPDSSHLARRLASLFVTREGTNLPEEAGDIGLEFSTQLALSSPHFHMDPFKGPGTSVPPDHFFRLHLNLSQSAPSNSLHRSFSRSLSVKDQIPEGTVTI